ncbi:hypothetical protein NP493_247g00003 [Ridgeia piscesae]|uniref:Major facilitator superfamily (MFS) profile domain-containing protein n=1 Tax=Ridgeia piscesae TaxID=27915 RepID=A0AAD9NYY5_RIDPI|nr:hypothetical protein NP493_247g00003 [Ridgeia piscesae]
MIMAPLTSLFATFGMLSLLIFAYFFRNWRHLQLAISVAGLPMVVYAWFCPESLRWLLANDRKEEAEAIIKRAAKFNNVPLPVLDLDEDDDDDVTKEDKDAKSDDGHKKTNNNRSVLALFRSPRPRRYFFIMFFMIFVNNVLYYGISLMSGALAGNIYMNFFINGILEVPAILFAVVVMTYLGRRKPMVAFQFFSSAAMLAAAASTTIKSDLINTPMLVTALSLTCKLGVGASYGVGLIYAQEIFPTNIRATCLGLAAGAGFIGSILAPFSVYLFRIVNWAPGVIFGLLALIAGLLTTLLPETYHRPLPTSVEEIAGWSRDDDERPMKTRKRDTEKRVTVATVIPATYDEAGKAKKEVGVTNIAYAEELRDAGHNGHTGNVVGREDVTGDVSLTQENTHV